MKIPVHYLGKITKKLDKVELKVNNFLTILTHRLHFRQDCNNGVLVQVH